MKFLHFFRHDWTKWEYYLSRNYWTPFGTLNLITRRKRVCLTCGKEEDQFFDYGDCR